MTCHERYHRQTLLPQIGSAGQQRLAAANVLLVGCGALGCHAADQLARAGVGHLHLLDRDVVELTNLQRQTLFDEADIGSAKAEAAARRLGRVNSSIKITPLVADFWAGNCERFVEGKIDLILDGTDNVQTRYLINDLAVQRGIPWIHAACVGTEGRVMPILPAISEDIDIARSMLPPLTASPCTQGEGWGGGSSDRPRNTATPAGACMRCIFETPPAAGELPTCDTAGVLQSAAAATASLQSALAIKLLTGNLTIEDLKLWKLDVWTGRFAAIDLTEARREECPCCGKRNFVFLEASGSESAVSLCGRNAVQIRPLKAWNQEQFDGAKKRLGISGEIEMAAFFWRCRLREPAGFQITCFRDGRLLIEGTADLGRAKAICARFMGA